MVATRTADRPHGSGHVHAPSRTAPEEGQGKGEESELNNAMGQKIPPPRAAGTVYFSMEHDRDVLAARPTPLVEVRPTGRGSAAHRGAHHRRLAVRANP